MEETTFVIGIDRRRGGREYWEYFRRRGLIDLEVRRNDSRDDFLGGGDDDEVKLGEGGAAATPTLLMEAAMFFFFSFSFPVYS